MINTGSHKINQKIESANILVNAELYTQALTLYWQACRDYIFSWLTNQQIVFNSTNEALRNAMLIVDDDTRAKIFQLEIVGTLAEWDEFFTVTKEQAVDFKNICMSTLDALGWQ